MEVRRFQAGNAVKVGAENEGEKPGEEGQRPSKALDSRGKAAWGSPLALVFTQVLRNGIDRQSVLQSSAAPGVLDGELSPTRYRALGGTARSEGAGSFRGWCAFRGHAPSQHKCPLLGGNSFGPVAFSDGETTKSSK
jgi:hypothetical protein